MHDANSPSCYAEPAASWQRHHTVFRFLHISGCGKGQCVLSSHSFTHFCTMATNNEKTSSIVRISRFIKYHAQILLVIRLNISKPCLRCSIFMLTLDERTNHRFVTTIFFAIHYSAVLLLQRLRTSYYR